MILYEYPLNDRLRSLLRLEDVFERFAFFRNGTDHHHHVQALAMLFDLLDVSGRTDIRSDLTTELKNQSQALRTFRDSPGVSAEALERLLIDIKATIERLRKMPGSRPGQAILDNEWLMAVRSRIMIAGGASDYDMPSFWAWQNLPLERRQRYLDDWHAPFAPLKGAVTLILRLLRESGKPKRLDAPDGSCQHSLGGHTYQMAQIRLDETLGFQENLLKIGELPGDVRIRMRQTLDLAISCDVATPRAQINGVEDTRSKGYELQYLKRCQPLLHRRVEGSYLNVNLVANVGFDSFSMGRKLL